MPRNFGKVFSPSPLLIPSIPLRTLTYYSPRTVFCFYCFTSDIMTSSVRPMQDIAFTVFYLFSGLRGWWSQKYFLDTESFIDRADDNVPRMEKSWLLHTVVLPMW